jgi:hypothetical protein
MNKLTISKLYYENKNFNEIGCDFINISVLNYSRYLMIKK